MVSYTRSGCGGKNPRALFLNEPTLACSSEGPTAAVRQKPVLRLSVLQLTGCGVELLPVIPNPLDQILGLSLGNPVLPGEIVRLIALSASYAPAVTPAEVP